MKQQENLPNTAFSPRFKRKMNRLFRERVGTDVIPHPEADNGWERLRSKILGMIRRNK